MLLLNITEISVCNRMRACANQNNILQNLFNGKTYVMSPVCLCFVLNIHARKQHIYIINKIKLQF